MFALHAKLRLRQAGNVVYGCDFSGIFNVAAATGNILGRLWNVVHFAPNFVFISDLYLRFAVIFIFCGVIYGDAVCRICNFFRGDFERCRRGIIE